jgi:lysozyme family protein
VAKFEISQAYVKRIEGGYSDDKRDLGNYICEINGKGYWAKKRKDGSIYCESGSLKFVGTNYGISAPVLSAYLGRSATVADMKGLSYNTALAIYKKLYWDKMQGDKINNQSLATMLYDGMVNQGEGAMASIVSDSLDTSVKIPFSDSVVSKINSANQKQLFETIQKKREERYRKTGGYALPSWLDRLKNITFEGFGTAIKFAKKNRVPIIIGTAILLTATTLLILNREKIIKTLN